MALWFKDIFFFTFLFGYAALTGILFFHNNKKREATKEYNFSSLSWRKNQLNRPFFYSLQCLLRFFVATKSGEAHIAFATWTKAYAGRANYVGTIEQFFKKLP